MSEHHRLSIRNHQHHLEHEAPSGQLHVIAVCSNPVMFRSRYELFRKFVAHMSRFNVNLIVVELAFGQRNFVVTEAGNPNHVQVRGSTELWHKENLINLGFQRLPANWEYAAWVDADVDFLNLNWVHDTLQALQHHPVVQLFQDCIDTGPTGEIVQTHRGFGYQLSQGQITPGKGYAFPHPGFAWAIRREAFDGLGRLIDWAILGAADHHMAWAFLGQVQRSIPSGLAPSYLARLAAFQRRCAVHVRGDVGYVSGLLVHHWHGKKRDRRYVERWDVLTKNGYDPDTDIRLNSHGVLELEHHKPRLRDEIRAYMRQRNEDSSDP